MFYEGNFSRPAGLIYEDYIDDYPPEGHLVKPFEIPPEWPRYIGVDFGGVHTAVVWLALDVGAGVLYAYRESLTGGKTSREHAAGVRAAAQGENFQGGWGGAQSETQWRMDWADAGVMLLPPPVADVEVGIDRVIGLWRTRRLFVFDTLSRLRDELGTYSRKMGDDGQPTEQIDSKQEFHLLDALRYVVLGLTAPTAPEEVVVYEDRVYVSTF